MSTGIDIQYIRKAYEQMTNEELVRIATTDAAGLTPEALEVVKEEINRRGLSHNILNALEAQNKEHTEEEIEAYCNLLSQLHCPGCGRATQRLNGTITGKVMSFIIFSQYNKKLKIACPSCLNKANNDALLSSLFLGWWGLPWGIIYTFQAIFLNLKNKRTNNWPDHNDYLKMFALEKIGILEIYKNNRDKLQEILKIQYRS
jgi:hypothetical protein